MLMPNVGFLFGQTKDITALKARIPELRDSTERTLVYARLGMLYTDRSLDSCYYFGSRALDLAKRIGSREGEAEALNVLAFYYNERANPYLAFKYINESLMLFQQLGKEEKVREVTMNTGVLLGRQGKHQEALSQFEKAYAQQSKHPRDSMAPLILMNLAYGRSFTSPLMEVIPLLDQAEQLARESENERFNINIRQVRNAIRFHKGIPTHEVIPEQYEIIQQAKEGGYEHAVATGYMELGNMYLTSEMDSALHYYDLGIELAAQTGYDVLHFHIMAQAYETLRQIRPTPPKAVLYGEHILKLAREKDLENQKVGMDFLQLSIREKELAAEEAKYKLRRTWTIGIVAISILAIVSALVVFRLYRRKRQLARDLRNKNEQLEAQNLQLGKSSVFHQTLISVMSHDLRQPLSSMVMLCERGIIEQLTQEQQHYVFEQLHQIGRSSLQAMDGIVHWMKLNALGLAYTSSVVNLKENIQSALEFNQGLANAKNITVEIDVSDSLETLAQFEMLQFVNRNILSNAIKFSPDGGRIAISANSGDDEHYVTLRISDNGSGIPSQILQSLFDKDRPSLKNGGSGLALILCYEMIKQMNGEIWAENNKSGHGASFYYRLPLVVQETNTHKSMLNCV